MVLQGFVGLFLVFLDFFHAVFGNVGLAVFLEGFLVEVTVPEENVAVVGRDRFEASFGGFFGGYVYEVLVEVAHFAVVAGGRDVLELYFLHWRVSLACARRNLS